MLGLGFGWVEVGTLTPLPQAGNPTPRLFRLPADRALINRLGFNNQGHEAGLDRLDRRAGRPGIVGVNIGANRDSEDRLFDYYAGVGSSRRSPPISPSTSPRLTRQACVNCRTGEALAELCGGSKKRGRRPKTECGRRTPLLLKVAPDLDDRALAI